MRRARPGESSGKHRTSAALGRSARCQQVTYDIHRLTDAASGEILSARLVEAMLWGLCVRGIAALQRLCSLSRRLHLRAGLRHCSRLRWPRQPRPCSVASTAAHLDHDARRHAPQRTLPRRLRCAGAGFDGLRRSGLSRLTPMMGGHLRRVVPDPEGLAPAVARRPSFTPRPGSPAIHAAPAGSASGLRRWAASRRTAAGRRRPRPPVPAGS